MHASAFLDFPDVLQQARDELAAEGWRAAVALEKKRILRRRSRWGFIKALITRRVVVTITWRN